MPFIVAALLGDAPRPEVDEAEIERLVHAARTGNPGAARQLYQQHVGQVYRSIRSLCRSDADAEDVVQETFERALGALGRFEPRPGRRFIGWLVAIAANTARKKLRSERLLDDHGQAVPDIPATEPTLEESEDCRRRSLLLLQAVAELPARDRLVLSLRYGAGLTAPEVGVATKMSSANVRKVCQRQRKALLQKLSPALADTAPTRKVRP